MAHFNGFPEEGLEFLDTIIINNSKEWLDAHKEEYEKIIDRNFKIYEDMLDLQQWIYELTCVKNEEHSYD